MPAGMSRNVVIIPHHGGGDKWKINQWRRGRRHDRILRHGKMARVDRRRERRGVRFRRRAGVSARRRVGRLPRRTGAGAFARGV